MGVLAAVLADGGRIFIDVTRVERRPVEGRREQQRQPVVMQNQVAVDGSCLGPHGRAAPRRRLLPKIGK